MAEINFNDIIEKAKELAQTAGEKSQEFYQVSKLKLEISELKMKREKNFASIGKQFYEAKKADEQQPDFEAIIEEIDLLNADIEEKKDLISSIKQTVRCESCGADIASDDPFCPKCGTSVK